MKRSVPILAALLFIAGCAPSSEREVQFPIAIQASARQAHHAALPENTPISTVADCMNSFAD